MGQKIDVDGVPTFVVETHQDVQGFELIDVRRDDEFNAELGHIEGAELATLGPELMRYLNSADKSKTILFICRSGARSANATLMATDMGFASVFNMQGGMMEWNQKGLKIVRD